MRQISSVHCSDGMCKNKTRTSNRYNIPIVKNVGIVSLRYKILFFSPIVEKWEYFFHFLSIRLSVPLYYGFYIYIYITYRINCILQKRISLNNAWRLFKCKKQKLKKNNNMKLNVFWKIVNWTETMKYYVYTYDNDNTVYTRSLPGKYTSWSPFVSSGFTTDSRYYGWRLSPRETCPKLVTAVTDITKLKVKNRQSIPLFLSVAENECVGGETINTVRYGEPGAEKGYYRRRRNHISLNGLKRTRSFF